MGRIEREPAVALGGFLTAGLVLWGLVAAAPWWYLVTVVAAGAATVYGIRRLVTPTIAPRDDSGSPLVPLDGPAAVALDE